jgi:hypothetical protein
MSKALVIGAFGARGTGKNAWVMQELERMKPERLLIWDYKHDPTLDKIGSPMRTMPELLRSLAAPRFKLRYLPTYHNIEGQFDVFCKAAKAAGCLVMVVDELPEVVKPSHAPPGWKTCLNVGRDYKVGPRRCWLTIIGMAQSPMEVDKTFVNNLDVLHTGRIGSKSAAQRLADSLHIDPRELMALPDLHWIEKRHGQLELARGVLSFSKRYKKPKDAVLAPKEQALSPPN